MKFLVITRPLGGGQKIANASATSYTAEIKKLHDSKVLEASYAFIGGGSAYVVQADTTKQLAVLVRSSPLFHSQSHEVIPIADAMDFLEGLAAYTG
jgi:hypothetical protein